MYATSEKMYATSEKMYDTSEKMYATSEKMYATRCMLQDVCYLIWACHGRGSINGRGHKLNIYLK